MRLSLPNPTSYRFVYDSCMATKTISIELDVYERLKALKNSPSESFSQVIRRTLPRPGGLAACDILKMIEDGSFPKVDWTDEEIEAIESIGSAVVDEEIDCG